MPSKGTGHPSARRRGVHDRGSAPTITSAIGCGVLKRVSDGGAPARVGVGLPLLFAIVGVRSAVGGECLFPADVDEHRADLAQRDSDLEADLADRLRLPRPRWIDAEFLEEALEPL